MHSREKYFDKISDLIENNISDPIQILNKLYETYFEFPNKRNQLSSVQPSQTTHTLTFISAKLTASLTEQNKSNMIEMLSAFLTFFPHLSLPMPLSLQKEIKPYELTHIIKSKVLSEDINSAAFKGKIQDLQDLILDLPDKGLALTMQLCREVKVGKSYARVSGSITSLGNLGSVIIYLPVLAQIQILRALSYALRKFSVDRLVPADALIKLIPQLHLPRQIEKLTQKLQATFKDEMNGHWIASTKVLNTIDIYYPLNPVKRHKIITFLLSKVERQPEAFVALGNLHHSITMEKDGGIAVVTLLRHYLTADSYVRRANAVKVLSKLTSVILKTSESSALLLALAEYIITIPEYYKCAYWPPELKCWEAVIESQADRGAAFFNILTQAALTNNSHNHSIIIDHMIFWKHLLRQLPDKGYHIVKLYTAALVNQQEKFRFALVFSREEVSLTINLLSNLKEILANFPNELLFVLEKFAFFWTRLTSVSYCRYKILETLDQMSDLISQLGEKAQTILKPMALELIDYQSKKSDQFHIPSNANKKQFLQEHIHIIDVWLTQDASDFLVTTFCQLNYHYPKQVSWVWAILDCFNRHKKTINMSGVTQALGRFYTMHAQQTFLFSHVPVKDITHIIHEYTQPQIVRK